MVFHQSLSDIKSPKVPRTLLSILTDFNNAVVWMVSTSPLIFKSSSPFINHLVTVARGPIIIGINTFLFDSFFNSRVRFRYLSFFSLSFSFILWSIGTAKSIIFASSFFFVDYNNVWSRLVDPFVCQNSMKACVYQFPGQLPGCAYTICWCGHI